MTLHAYLHAMTAMRLTDAEEPPAGWSYWCMEDYVLDRGTVHESASLTENELDVLLRAITRTRIRFEYKQCFYNAQMVAVLDDSGLLRYTEGYAIGRSIPCLHGWLTINGKVVDLTWRTDQPNHEGRLGDRIFGVLPKGWVYMGVSFDTHAVRSRMIKTGQAASFLDDLENRWPLLREPRLSTCKVEPLPLAG